MKRCPECQRCYEDLNERCAVDDTPLLSSRTGSRIIAGKYRLDRRLGRGGMGAVYEGTHIELDRPVAIKLLLPEFTNDAQALERFRREARAAARLNHPNVADTYDYGSLPDGGAYIVMELLEGLNLREYMNSHGPLPIAETLIITRQVATGIEAAHRRGIIHRDLKPANIILINDAHDGLLAKVLDFGIAKLKEHSLVSGNTLTHAGMLIGTPRYMSPEQCGGHELDARSDIYSLGVILYEMLTHRPPFDAISATAIAIKHIQDMPPPLERFRPDVPSELSRIVLETLHKEPARRPQSAAELAIKLRELQTSLGYSSSTNHLDAIHPPREFSSAAPTVYESFVHNTAEDRLAPHTDRAGVPTVDDAARSHSGSEADSKRVDAGGKLIFSSVYGAETAAPASARRSYKSLLAISLGVFFTVAVGVFWFNLRSQRESILQQTEASDSVAPAPDSQANSNTLASSANSRNAELSPISGTALNTAAATNGAANVAVDVRTTDANPNIKLLRTALNEWVAATNRQDLAGQMSHYAANLQRFYQARNVSRARVEAEKAGLFSSADTVEMRVGALQIKVQPNGRTATMRFHKRYRVEGAGQSRSGEVVQELVWERTPEGWRIVTEYDVRVIG